MHVTGTGCGRYPSHYTLCTMYPLCEYATAPISPIIRNTCVIIVFNPFRPASPSLNPSPIPGRRGDNAYTGCRSFDVIYNGSRIDLSDGLYTVAMVSNRSWIRTFMIFQVFEMKI